MNIAKVMVLKCLISFFVGITKLRFKPAYNPYTEPSMEVFSYHEGILIYYYVIYYYESSCEKLGYWLKKSEV